MTFKAGCVQKRRPTPHGGWPTLGALRAREMREWFAIHASDGAHVQNAAIEFGVSYNQAWRCLVGDSYRDVGGPYTWLRPGSLRFSDNMVRQIRRMVLGREIKQRKLAGILNVKEGTLSRLVNRHTYKWVE